MKTGERIKFYREQKGISQSDLAIVVGYKTRSSITKIEKGESDPSQKMLIKIADALEVSPSALLGDEPLATPQQSKPKLDESTITIQYPETRILAEGFDQMPEEAKKIIMETFHLVNTILSKKG